MAVGKGVEAGAGKGVYDSTHKLPAMCRDIFKPTTPKSRSPRRHTPKPVQRRFCTLLPCYMIVRITNNDNVQVAVQVRSDDGVRAEARGVNSVLCPARRACTRVLEPLPCTGMPRATT